jgi:O-antigen ligase
MTFYERIQRSASQKLQWATFFMAYPFIVVVQNISFYFIIWFYIVTSRYYVKFFRVGSLMSIGAVLFAIGAIISTIGAGIKFDSDLFFNSVKILPNYIYWATLIIGLGNICFKIIKIIDLYRVIFWGVVASISSYHILPFIFPFIGKVSQNAFAFLLIIFSPIATSYVHQSKRNNTITIFFIFIVTLAGFLSGSRSGSILTLIGCFSVLALNSWVNMIMLFFFTTFMTVAAPEIIVNPNVKSAIRGLNERTYELIYNTDETLETDLSYLTRLALIEKGMSIFKDHPITGVGVNNFTKLNFDIQFEFEGGQLLEHKEETIAEGTSAHNSYISVLSEGGILLLMPMLFLMFYPTFYFVTKFNQIDSKDRAIFIGVIFMSIHSWFISGMLNVFGWYLLGLANSYIIYKKPSREL